MRRRLLRLLQLVALGLPLLFVVAVLYPSEASADRTTATTIFHSGKPTIAGVNQLVETTEMQQRVCVGWMFQNLGTATIYLNVNANATPAAAGSYDDQLVLEAGEWRELEVHRITRFQAISDGTSDLYWSCICHSS